MYIVYIDFTLIIVNETMKRFYFYFYYLLLQKIAPEIKQKMEKRENYMWKKEQNVRQLLTINPTIWFTAMANLITDG